MTKIIDDISFNEFLSFFPEIELPVILTEDSIKDFSSLNKALPIVAIQKFLMPFEEDKEDEFLEFVPCMSFSISERIVAIVYWRGSLLSYEYYLVTMDLQGNRISSKVIAGVISNGQKVQRSAATINDDFTIQLAINTDESAENNIEKLKSYYMEIMPSGEIISYKEDTNLWQEKQKITNPKH